MKQAIVLLFLASVGYATLRIDEPPTTVIKKKSSGLDRPEGVAFSPSGKHIAAANALIDTITFYRRVGNSGSLYETTPAFSIQGAGSLLNYPHDIAFSPDGLSLAVANRLGSSITIYKKHPKSERFESNPIAQIQGGASRVLYPDSVRYSPTEPIIAVANLGNHSICLYRYDNDQYEQKPYQVIWDSKKVLLVPDSLDFSSDGEFLAVTSHDTHSVLIYQRIPNSDGFFTRRPVQVLKGDDTHFCFPHSVSFDPISNALCVSNAQGKENIHIFEKIADSPPFYNNTPSISIDVIEMYDESTIHLLEQLQQEGGCKGVAFSPDGTALAVTQNLCDDLKVVPQPVGVLVVYPVKRDE